VNRRGRGIGDRGSSAGGTRTAHGCAAAAHPVGNFLFSRQARAFVWEENKIFGFFCNMQRVVNFLLATSTRQVDPNGQNTV
jgi:hypothetical protein